MDTHRAAGIPWHRGFAPHEVDLMSISTVAAFLGVGISEAKMAESIDRAQAQGTSTEAKMEPKPGSRLALALAAQEAGAILDG